ncbi:uncharacterized protein LOC124154658 [Ischnura elegans]|uniref:uncharacterized protein LOC124154658 n=1 Tax=Ischnura elegans TaxID=197161 RepID=UPI001ED8B3A2|nr:uncharacterized protein LOC124154658 [Ischnura elegans]
MDGMRALVLLALVALGSSSGANDAKEASIRGPGRQLFTSLRIEEPPPGSLLTEVVRVPSHSKQGPASTLIVRKAKQQHAPLSAAAASSPVGIAVPPPVLISSEPLKMEEKEASQAVRSGRKLEQQQQRTHVDSDGIVVIEGIRVPDDEDDKRGKVWRNARVINNRLVPGITPNDQNPPSVETNDAEGHQRGRMLRFGGGSEPSNNQVVSASLLFDGAAATRREPITEAGVRTPVLQYAHPELGIQEARPAPLEDEEQEFQVDASRVSYRNVHSEDEDGMHDDHSPFAFEPADAQTSSLQRSQDQVDAQRRQEGGGRPKTLSYFLSPQDNLAETEDENDDYYKYKGYRQGYGPYSGGKNHYRYKYAPPQVPVVHRPHLSQPLRYAGPYESSGSSNVYAPRAPGKGYYPPRPLPPPQGPPPPAAPFPDLSLPAGLFEGLIFDHSGALGKSLWQRISDHIRSHVQTGVEKVSDFTRPVMQPIVEATRKISHNLGLTKQSPESEADEKVGVVGAAATTGGLAQTLASPAVLLPALGIMAGGAALGLGAVAVGRFVDHTSKSSVVYADVNDDIGAPLDDDARSSGQRRRRSVNGLGESGESDENFLDRLEVRHEAVMSKLQQYGVDAWKETPCAKRIFCDVMTQQPEDTVVLMEKRMSTFLSLIHPSVAQGVSMHLGDVMDAVRRGDCSAFACSEQQMRLERRTLHGGGGGQVDASRVVAPAPGPGPRR